MPIQKSNFSTGGASVAQDLQQWSAERQARLTQKNMQKSADAGATAGMSGEYEEKTAAFGIFGRDTVDAYNNSMQSAYISKLDSDNVNRITQIALENPDNLQAYDAAVDGVLSGLSKEVDPAVREVILQSAQDSAARARLGVQRSEIARNTQSAAASRADASSTYLTESARFARNGDMEGSAENLLKFEATQDARLDAGDIDLAARNELVRSAERESVEQTNLGNLDRLATDEAQSWIDSSRTKIPQGFSPDEWDSHMDAAQSDLNRRLSREAAQRAEMDQENRLRVNDYTNSALLGSAPSREEREIVEAIDPEAKARADQVSQFAVMSQSDRQSVVDNTSLIESQDPLGVALLRESNNLVNQKALKDPYSLAVQQGIVGEVAIDFNDPNTLAMRARQSDMIAEHYNVPSKPLTEREAESFSASIPTMTIEDQIAAINSIQTSGATEIFEQIAGKNQLVFATAGAINEFSVMHPILRGQEMINLGTAKKPTQSEYLDEFNSFVGDVYEGVNRQATLEAAIAHYVTKGNVVFDSGDFQASLEAVTGGVDEVNGSMVELPRGVQRRDFERYLDEFTPAAVEKFGGAMGFNNEQAAEAIRRGMPRSVGQNMYEIDFNGLPMKGMDGKNLVIQYLPELAPVSRFGRSR